MGSSASTINKDNLHHQYNYGEIPFPKLDELCQKGYFVNNIGAYKYAMETAIRTCRLDALEILIPAGRVRNTWPLHLSAKYSVTPLYLFLKCFLSIEQLIRPKTLSLSKASL